MLETGLSVIVENITCIFLRSACFLKKKAVRWRHLGKFEIAVLTFGVVWVWFCLISLFIASLFEISFVLYGNLYFVFQSLLSCSLVSSLGKVKMMALERKNNQSDIILSQKTVK